MKQKIPRKAVVLAAGFGTRLLPLTRIRPKALLPLGGRPMLEHSLRLLASWGVDDVLVNSHWLADQIVDFLRGFRLPGMKITISYEPEILGTGGVLRRAEWFLGKEPFWMLNADVAAELDPAPLVKLFCAGKPLAVLWLHPERGPRTVELRGNQITTFSSRNPGTPGTCTFCGLQLLSPAIMEYLPPDGFSSIITAYQNGLKAGRAVLGAAISNSYWADIGSPKAYLEAQREICEAHRKKKSGRFLYFSDTPGGSVHPSAQLINSIVMDHAVVGPRAKLENAIVAPGCRINARASNLLVPAMAVLENNEAEQIGRIEDTCAEMLPGRGSGRTFIRLHRGRAPLMLIRHTYERAENRRYIGHAALLRDAGVNVPEIYFHSGRRAFTLMEDLGTNSLLEIVRSGKDIPSAFRRVLDQVILFHENACDLVRRKHHALEPPFTRRLYEWEHNLFCEKYLAGYLHLNEAAIRGIRDELRSAGEALLRLPRVLLHRDLQSSNIIFKQGRPFFIDFQGMRMGPAVYDLASLLCDPYVMLEEDLQMRLLSCYRQRAAATVDEEIFWLAAVQRLCQALGAYARLGALPQGRRFLDSIPPARSMLARALNHAPHFPALRARVSR